MAGLQIPFFVAGRRVAPTPSSSRTLDLVGGQTATVPVLDQAVVEDVLQQDPFALRDVPLDRIIAFLRNVGENWKSEEYSRRRVYIRHLVKYLGYSQEMAEHEADWIAMLLCSHYRLMDTVAAELGSRHILDRWVPNEEALVRAFPRGRVMHILAGNVPLAGVTSILRALVTKNTCIVKASSGDPITPAYLAMSFLDADSSNPVAQALSVVHWQGGESEPLAARLAGECHAIAAWGGHEAMRWAGQHAAEDAEVLRFGPRRSLAVVGSGAEPNEAARRLAHDICMYDQRACYSVQQVFVSQPVEPFVSALEGALENYRTLVPRGVHSFDEHATCALVNLESRFYGADVRMADDESWSIIACPPQQLEGHPLGRTIFVHPIASFSDVTPLITSNVQTVAVYPWSVGEQARNEFAAAGACRIVELGLNNVWRTGGAHDGTYPLHRLVRLVSQELPSHEHVKGITVPVDQTKFLEEGRFTEFIP